VAVGVITIVIVTLAPAVIVPMLQLTRPAAWEQLPCVELAETNVVPAGSVSPAVTPVAVLGPLLVTTTV
jgi:hypothetical protein